MLKNNPETVFHEKKVRKIVKNEKYKKWEKLMIKIVKKRYERLFDNVEPRLEFLK